jgi:hypothetical protein
MFDNRYARQTEKCVWVHLLEAVAQAGGPPTQVPIDSSAVKARRSAAGRRRGNEKLGGPRIKSGDALAQWPHAKIDALSDAHCRPVAFLVTGSQPAWD